MLRAGLHKWIYARVGGGICDESSLSQLFDHRQIACVDGEAVASPTHQDQSFENGSVEQLQMRSHRHCRHMLDRSHAECGK